MSKVLVKLKLLFKLFRSYFPTPLPVGMTAFQAWSDDIIALVGPIADADSLRFAIASQIMHLPAQKSSVPMQFFIQSLRKAAANQVASAVFQDIKLKQQAAAAQAAKSTTAAEATTATQSEVANVVNASASQAAN